VCRLEVTSAWWLAGCLGQQTKAGGGAKVNDKKKTENNKNESRKVLTISW